MKLILPLAIAILGLGAGIGAGVALKPPPAEEHAAVDCVEGVGESHAVPSPGDGEHGAAGPEGLGDCPTDVAGGISDPFAPVAPPKSKPEGETANVPLDKPFVVPVFKADKVTAMIVSSMALELAAEGAPKVEGLEPRLRDSFLAVMFRHANSGGFDGTFTEGRKMDDLGSALLVAARSVFEEAHVEIYDVLITDIVRQDM